MWLTALHIAEFVLWAFMAYSVGYVFLFSLASLLPRRRRHVPETASQSSRFLILVPAYKEDRVILQSAQSLISQDYPTDNYCVAIISDHMQPATNEQLASLPLRLLTPSFDRSSKARALQYAMQEVGTAGLFDRIVIIDADNVVGSDFLSKLDAVCHQGFAAIQCHRTAKNLDSDIAVLDGISEEMNNSIFRRGHNRLGLSAALIGSGMCFDYEWFASHVNRLDSAVEDRELEAFLMKEGIFVHYAEHIFVMDEKVSSGDNFQRQRLRWMTGQVQCLQRMSPNIPRAIATGNINYIDKTLQQALIPRSILLVLLPFFGLLTLLLARGWTLKWWLLFAALCIALTAAIPARMRTGAILGKVRLVPQLVWRMLRNVVHINTRNKEFLHTTHGDNNDGNVNSVDSNTSES